MTDFLDTRQYECKNSGRGDRMRRGGFRDQGFRRDRDDRRPDYRRNDDRDRRRNFDRRSRSYERDRNDRDYDRRPPMNNYGGGHRSRSGSRERMGKYNSYGGYNDNRGPRNNFRDNRDGYGGGDRRSFSNDRGGDRRYNRDYPSPRGMPRYDGGRDQDYGRRYDDGPDERRRDNYDRDRFEGGGRGEFNHNEEKQRIVREGLCFICKQKGHKAADCPDGNRGDYRSRGRGGGFRNEGGRRDFDERGPPMRDDRDRIGGGYMN